MDIPDIGGLPAHPLVVHLPVVLVPLATIGALIMLIRPSWRRSYELPVAVLAVVAAVATQLALMSGEQLEEDVRRSELIEKHSQIAEQARPFVFVFAALMVAVAVWDIVQRRRVVDDRHQVAGPDEELGQPSSGSIATARRTSSATTARSRAASVAVVLTALGLVFGVISTVQIYRTGHSGATATWHDDDDDGG